MVNSLAHSFTWMKTRLTNLKRFLNARKDANKQTKIIDLNIDCIQEIFSYLSVVDLMNVADSNRCLKNAANLSFAQRYGKKSVQLNIVPSYQRQRKRIFRKVSAHSKIYIIDLKSSLQLLRCFSNSIPQLEVTDEHSNKLNVHIYKYIFLYINKFCAKSLTDIEFREIPKNNFFDSFKKPFESIKSVEFFGCSLIGNHLKPFNILFPNVQSLTIDFTEMKDFHCIEHHFEKPEKLQITTCMENIDKMIRINSQIKLFATKFICDIKLLQTISKELFYLNRLEIVCDCDELTHYNLSAIVFRMMKKLKLDFSHSKCTFPKIPLIIEQLEELSIRTNHPLKNEFQNFLLQHLSLIQLNLPLVSHRANMTTEHQFDFLKKLKSLKQLNLRRFTFSTHQSIRFFDKFDALNTFSFTVQCHQGNEQWKCNYDELINRTKMRWQVRKYNGFSQHCQVGIEEEHLS